MEQLLKLMFTIVDLNEVVYEDEQEGMAVGEMGNPEAFKDVEEAEYDLQL